MLTPLPTGACHPQTMRVDTLDAFAAERDREVRGILQSINDLAQIMKDLSVLVIDQGTIVDRIDYNMEQARGPGPLHACASGYLPSQRLISVFDPECL